MFSPRWQKLRRDLALAKGRTAMMVIAIAVGVFGVGTVLIAYAILTREISRNYLGANPASATLELDKAVDDELLVAVRQRPGIADGQARATVMARVQIGPDEWRPLLLFVVEDFNAMRISTFKPDGGMWPPPDGTMLVERSALPVVNARVGDAVVVKTPNGQRRAVPITGLTHDTGLAPAWQEREGYGYITPATLAWLGENTGLNEVKIIVSGTQFDVAGIERTARDLAAWLQGRGYAVKEIQVPPPGRHPHQNQMVAILTLLLTFSLMALVLGAVLVATMINGLLAHQIRQIGVMKTVGAKMGQVAGLYVTLVLLISGAAVALGAPFSVMAGRAYASAVSDLLNFTLFSDAIPPWVFIVQATFGLLVPVLLALIPILRTSRITVREAISDFGVSQTNFGNRRLDRLLGMLAGLNRPLLLALRNTFRRRARLLLTLGLLAAGGGMFMTGLNIAAAWDRNLADSFATRRYDLEIRLSHPEPTDTLLKRLSGVPGVQKVEAWGYAPIAPARPGEIDIAQTYPDKGHGSFSLFAPPSVTTLVNFPVLSGRWLQHGESDAVVLNQTSLTRFPGAAPGDVISLSINGRPTAWRVVGIVREIGPAAAYVTDEAFARAAGLGGRARSLRIVTSGHDTAARGEAIRAIERSLANAGIGVELGLSASEFRNAITDHIVILIGTLLSMAALMAIVGALGLASAMSASVLERTREFGVIRSVGGAPGAVLGIVMSEGAAIGLMSWFVAIAVSLPLSIVVGNLVGRLAFRVSLPLVISPRALLLWLAIIIVGSAAATAIPARRASRLTVRESLAYE